MSITTGNNSTRSQGPGEAGTGDASPPVEPDTAHPAGRDSGAAPREIGGRKGPDPARYGDWEKQGRCIDF